MKPSIGRVVHYVATSWHGDSIDGGTLHHAAMVTEVASNHPLNAVSLFVMGPTGLSVQLDVPHDDNHRVGSWHFPERVE